MAFVAYAETLLLLTRVFPTLFVKYPTPKLLLANVPPIIVFRPKFALPAMPPYRLGLVTFDVFALTLNL